MSHRCDVCQKPAGYRYRNQWNCKAHYEDRRALFAAFEAVCKHQAKCLRPGMLPSSCETCGLNMPKKEA